MVALCKQPDCRTGFFHPLRCVGARVSLVGVKIDALCLFRGTCHMPRAKGTSCTLEAMRRHFPLTLRLRFPQAREQIRHLSQKQPKYFLLQRLVAKCVTAKVLHIDWRGCALLRFIHGIFVIRAKRCLHQAPRLYEGPRVKNGDLEIENTYYRNRNNFK